MEEDQAFLFGDVVLSFFCPKVLIVSTPNFEYNVILHKSTVQGQEDDPDEKNQSQSSKFRNHDDKFEWTREQFNDCHQTLQRGITTVLHSAELAGLMVWNQGMRPKLLYFGGEVIIFRKMSI